MTASNRRKPETIRTRTKLEVFPAAFQGAIEPLSTGMIKIENPGTGTPHQVVKTHKYMYVDSAAM